MLNEMTVRKVETVPVEENLAVLSRWQAELHLGFIRKAQKTILAKRSHKGPLTVQRPFYPEGGLCHVYILHPPGGVVAGDCLLIDVHAADDTEALVTTPAAGKFYRSDGKQASQTVSIKVEAGAVVEWLPQETIVYQGARLCSTVDIELADDARFMAWEILALGRPAAGEGFESGEVLLNWQLHRNGQPIYLEKIRLDAEAFSANWGLNSQSSCGTFFASPANQEHLKAVRQLIGENKDLAVTLIDDLLICRAVNDKTAQVRQFFENVRALVRRDIVHRQPYAPRIWAT